MNKILFAAAAGFGVATSASASTVVDGSCVSVTDSAGCLFDGNINGNPNPTNVNGFKNAENAYNVYNDTHVSAQPDITLNFITKSDDANFGDFGSITGGGTSSGTWALPGFLVDFLAVKAGDNFVLYQLASPASSGSWDTLNIPFRNNPKDLSHLAFFGTAVPEPATWAMMLGGFGLLGAVARRRRRVTVAFA